ncbi:MULTISPECIES: hypothetical protein [Vibrio]|uniref:hypothetical protein n=1 Tax=Vibrio TaxID=662 RepID=UPI00078C7C1D|nr:MULTISPECIES: hypothetical protein [Vibrio]BAU70941.1 hypothetical protein [Vibrio sp. 04Ya108]BBM67801.1 hypothetical protein VA249_44470 [Vibrio alfacsensis]BCN26972.1 hypothetical protein VYA_41640 [Vibrio alfacsensis]
MIEIFEWSTDGGSYKQNVSEYAYSTYCQNLESRGYKLTIHAISGWRLYRNDKHRILVSET